MHFTNIVGTVGPSCSTPELLQELLESGVGVFRFNFSHGTHEDQRKAIKMVREVEAKMGKPCAVMLDTKGPEIRTADLKYPLELQKDQEIILSVEHGSYQQTGKIEVNYDEFVGDVSVGDKILIDNGTINFLVKGKTETDVICTVLDGGTLRSRRHINLPGIDPSLATITDKDWKDIKFGLKQGIDFIALSFVRSATEIHELRAFLEHEGHGNVKIIAKVESFEATQNLEAIIKAADGTMVARGDLGAEVPFEKVPQIQKDIVQMCHYYRKPVIVATQMLESMIQHPIPTRAEVTDVATAVWQKADCIMLSGETASGKYPVKAVQAMSSIVEEIERETGQDHFRHKVLVENDKVGFAKMAAQMVENAEDLECIVVITRTGSMARSVSAFRPPLPIIACVPDIQFVRQMEMVWGCTGYEISFNALHPQQTVVEAEKEILKHRKEWNGKKYLLVSEFLEDDQFVPTLQLRTLDGKG